MSHRGGTLQEGRGVGFAEEKQKLVQVPAAVIPPDNFTMTRVLRVAIGSGIVGDPVVVLPAAELRAYRIHLLD